MAAAYCWCITAIYILSMKGQAGTHNSITYEPPCPCRIFNYAEYQIDYLLGACGRSLLSGYGSGYPTSVWHKYSYNAYIDWPLRGQYSFYGNVRGPWTTPTTGPDGPIYVQVSLDSSGMPLLLPLTPCAAPHGVLSPAKARMRLESVRCLAESYPISFSMQLPQPSLILAHPGSGIGSFVIWG